jgi:hypothetical protein
MIVSIPYATRAEALSAAAQARLWPGFVRAIVSTRAGGFALNVSLSYPD